MSVYNKKTFPQWLKDFKSFNSMKHFKKYIESLRCSQSEKEEVIEYYREEYNSWFKEQFPEVAM